MEVKKNPPGSAQGTLRAVRRGQRAPPAFFVALIWFFVGVELELEVLLVGASVDVLRFFEQLQLTNVPLSSGSRQREPSLARRRRTLDGCRLDPIVRSPDQSGRACRLGTP